MEFGAIVEGERLEPVTVATDGARRRSRHVVLVSQPLDDRVSGLAFLQREHAMPHVAAHHGVALPMSDALAPFDFNRVLANGPLANGPLAG